MAKFESVEEAKLVLNNSLVEINEILQRDLPVVPKQLRTVDLWFQQHGKNRTLDLTKDRLRKLEMEAIDCEIFLLDEKREGKSLSDTYC